MRSLLIVMTVIACVLGWFMFEYRRFERERLAVTVLSSRKETILFAKIEKPPLVNGLSMPGGLSMPDREPVFDLSELSHGRIYRPIEHVHLLDDEIDDEAAIALNSFRHVSSLSLIRCHWTTNRPVFEERPHLVNLQLEGSQLQERDMYAIAALPQVKQLALSGADMPAGSATIISRMKLKSLTLEQMPIADAAMVNISRMSQLHSLDLKECQFSSDAVLNLGRLQQLEILDLSSTSVDDRLFVHFEFPKLEALMLADTALTDEGLRGIVRNQNLIHLDLRNTQITDEGVKELVKLPKLFAVNVSGTEITQQSLETLKTITTLDPMQVVTGLSP